jgi:hypothetical protein
MKKILTLSFFILSVLVSTGQDMAGGAAKAAKNATDVVRLEDLPGGIIDSCVMSFNTRTGAVIPTLGDYTTANMDTTITGFATKAALLNYQSKIFINVKDYGAVGDSTTDNTTAIRNAILAGAGGTIYFPKGNYIISDTLNIPKSCKILGNGGLAPYTGTGGTNPVGSYQGGNSVIIQTNGAKSAFVVSADGTSFDGVTIKHSGATATAGAGILIYKGNSTRINNVFAGGFYRNIQANSLTESAITNSQFADAVDHSLYISGVINDEGDNNITGNWFNGSSNGTSVDIYADHPGGLRINNNKFHVSVGTSNGVGGCIDIMNEANTSDLIIENNSIEAYNTFAIRFKEDSATRTFNNILIQGNQFRRVQGAGLNIHDIDIEALIPGKVSMVVISNNSISNAGTVTSVFLNGVNNYGMLNNVFESTTNQTTFTNCTNNTTTIFGNLSLGTHSQVAAKLDISGNNSAAASGSAGFYTYIRSATLTDTTSVAGTTVSSFYPNVIQAPVLASKGTLGSPVTYTTAATLYINNAPSVTTGTVITNPLSLDVVSGNVNISTITGGQWKGTAVTVPFGGTGATTLTGVVKGNGTGAFTAAVAGTDYALTTSHTASFATNGTTASFNVIYTTPGYTPSNIAWTPSSGIGSAGYYITSITSTGFTVNYSTAPATGTATAIYTLIK